MAGPSPSEEEILQLVAERESMRQARRFAESDAIREQLRSMGVELYDKEREWRARDGRRGRLFTAGPSVCSLSPADIQDIITMREEARANKDWAHADLLRDDLRRQGVELDDRTRTWRTSSGTSGSYSGQALPSSSVLSEADIRALVADRERARAAQDFATADELRRRLLSMGVELFDSDRVWKANDGRQGVIVTGGSDIIQCTLGDADIRMRIQMREDARSRKDWETADSIRDELRRVGVELIDSEQKWRTTDGRTGRYAGAQFTHSSTTATSTRRVAASRSPLRRTDVALPRETGRHSGGAASPRTLASNGGHHPTPAVDTNKLVQATSEALSRLQATGTINMGSQQVMKVATAAAQAYKAAQQHSRAQAQSAVAAAVVSALATAGLVDDLGGTETADAALSTASIQALVDGRETAREERDFAAADAIREDLRQHGVEVWDKQKTWKASDGRHGAMSPAVPGAAAVPQPVTAAGGPRVPRLAGQPRNGAAIAGAVPDLAAAMGLAGR